MKKVFLFLIIYLLVSVENYSQNVSDVDVTQRKEYMIKTYKINAKKADAYEKLRIELLQENDKLKEQKMTSSQFKNKQKKLYKKYGDEISQAFSKGRYRSWSIMTQELEYYHMLCDTKLVPRDKMRSLQKLESEAEEKRTTINESGDAELDKLEDKYKMMENQKEKIRQLLGTEDGDWYINYKQMYFISLINMDKYKTSFKNAYAIAEIEKEYGIKRAMIFKSKKKFAEREEDFFLNEENKIKAINAAVPSDVAARWKKVNADLLEYNLTSKYGLTQAQVNQFKKNYSKYAIEEYKILSSKKISDADKYTQLNEISNNFCKSVSQLFSPLQYNKWQGWWQYTFDRKMKMKGLK
ncbi:MAG: hypothetical protein H9802_15840 [Candidatus Phocaeicola faecipullorum]|nr:hypothetical protein [Candidatus Phocaeicola faecipullorum]